MCFVFSLPLLWQNRGHSRYRFDQIRRHRPVLGCWLGTWQKCQPYDCGLNFVARKEYLLTACRRSHLISFHFICIVPLVLIERIRAFVIASHSAVRAPSNATRLSLRCTFPFIGNHWARRSSQYYACSRRAHWTDARHRNQSTSFARAITTFSVCEHNVAVCYVLFINLFRFAFNSS